MSKQFLQVGYNKDTLELYSHRMDNANDHAVALIMPKTNAGEYQKSLLESTCNLLQEVAYGISLTKQSGSQNITQSGIHEEFVITMRTIADMLQYITNSTSWGLQDMKQFDAIELCNRLTMAQNVMRGMVKQPSKKEAT